MFGRATKQEAYPKRFIEGEDYIAFDNPRYKYKIIRDKTFWSPALIRYQFKGRFLSCKDGLLTMKEGYASDGPSGPTIDTGSFMRGAFFHDALYQMMRQCRMPLEEKDFSDMTLKNMCLEDGMWAFRAWYVHRGVKKHGHASCVPENCEYQAQK